VAEAARLTRGSDRACAQLLRRLLRKPDAVSREEFLAISAWEPLMAPVFMDLYLGMSAELPLIAPQLRRLKSTKKRAGEALHNGRYLPADAQSSWYPRTRKRTQ
jgi:hypothetical protein